MASFKQGMTKGAGAGAIALGGMLVSIATGFISQFSIALWGLYVAGCLGLMWLIMTRENEIKAQSQRSETNKSAELDAHFEKLQAETKDAKTSYEKAQKDLADIIRLMPPAHTMKDFSRTYKAIRQELRLLNIRALNARDHSERSTICAGIPGLIRKGLDALCQLMLRYQPQVQNNHVSANLMRYHQLESVKNDPTLCNFVNEHIRFVEVPSEPLQNLKGVLTLEKELSASTRTDNPSDFDAEIVSLAMPIPDTELFKNGEREAFNYFIPVAPRGFAEGLQFHNDISTLTGESYYKSGHIGTNVRHELMDYFSKTKDERKIGSIVSIGLGKRFLSETEEGIAWGVINIHSEGKSSMNDEMIQSFTDVSRPILELLKDLLILHSELISQGE